MKYKMKQLLVAAGTVLLASTAFSQLQPKITDLLDKKPKKSYYGIELGDLNNDKRVDIAYAIAPHDPKFQPGNTKIMLFYQREDGTFNQQPDKELTLEVPAWSFCIGDFDNDGKNDIAAGQRVRRKLILFLGKDNFENPIVNYNGNDSAGPSLSWGHLNKKPNADFMCGTLWRKWQGGKKFSSSYMRGPGNSHDNYNSYLIDLNWDKLDDIIFINNRPKGRLNDEIRIYYGPFQEASIFNAEWAAEVVVLKAGPFKCKQLLAGDINGDEQPDIIYCGQEPKKGVKTLIFPQNQPAGFTKGAGPAVTLEGVSAPAVVGDVNGDGLKDLMVSDQSKKTLYLFLQKKDWSLPKSVKQADAKVSLSRIPVALRCYDLDGDKSDEILLLTNKGNVRLIDFSIQQNAEQNIKQEDGNENKDPK